MRPLVPTEDWEQKTLARYLDFRPDMHGADGQPYWCHVPNGGARTITTGARLKEMGAKPGVPDVLIFRPFDTHLFNTGRAVGLAIELKRQKGSHVSKEQRQWLAVLAEMGWIAKIARGAHDAIELIEQHYGSAEW